MSEVKNIRGADVRGKRVLVRVDFNVPLKDGAVADDERIVAALPTIELLRARGAVKIILLAHLGRPGGKVDENLRMEPIASWLTKNLDHKNSSDRPSAESSAVGFQNFSAQDFSQYQITNDISLLENLRFNPGEEANDPSFAQKLASLGDIFVQDAFADLHRAHSSIVGVPKLLPSHVGLLVEKEIRELTKALNPPPLSVAILGGAKFETKEPLLAKLLSLYEKVLLGGALANDIIKARGMPFGTSLVSDMPVPVLLAGNKKLVIPKDVIVESDTSASRECFVNDVRANERMVDIGQATAREWAQEISHAPFVLWSGPMGVYEKNFTAGTDALAGALAASNCRAVVGGGDTLASIKKYQFNSSKVFLSTGGGAMLQFLTDGELVGVDALRR